MLKNLWPQWFPPPFNNSARRNNGQALETTLSARNSIVAHQHFGHFSSGHIHSTMSNTEMCHGLGISFRTASMMLGTICGTFVQFSSLAANYYIWTFRYNHHGHSNTVVNRDDVDVDVEVKKLLLMNFCWSLFTSSIAFSVLAILRTMIEQNDDIQIQLEKYFTFGALGGLCASWILTDAAFGTDTNLLSNGVVLVVASVCFKLLIAGFAPRKRQSELAEIVKPLLSPEESEGIPVVYYQNESGLRWMGLQCGLLIGLFIQLSGLGANSLFLGTAPTSGRQRLILSVGWSFMTSCLGILALFYVRQILLIGSGKISASNLLAIECFFASGATIGLNVAWTITDTALGLKPHVWGSVIATLVTFGWCGLILHCTDEADDDQHHLDEDTHTGNATSRSVEKTHMEEHGLLLPEDV